jgi:hypothetical protein
VTTLSTEQFADLRLLVGDECTPAWITDEQIDALYVRAAGVTVGNADRTEALTVVYIIRRLLGKAAVKVDTRSDVGGESRSQWFDHLQDLLGYYERLAGVNGGTLFTGSLQLGIDATNEEAWLADD